MSSDGEDDVESRLQPDNVEIAPIDGDDLRVNRKTNSAKTYVLKLSVQPVDYEDRVEHHQFGDGSLRGAVSAKIQNLLRRHPDVDEVPLLTGRSDVTKDVVRKAMEVAVPKAKADIEAVEDPEIAIVNVRVFEKQTVRKVFGTENSHVDEYGNYRPFKSEYEGADSESSGE